MMDDDQPTKARDGIEEGGRGGADDKRERGDGDVGEKGGGGGRWETSPRRVPRVLKMPLLTTQVRSGGN